MGQFYFGTGNVACKTSTDAVVLGTLQEISIEFNQTIESLRGQNKLPDAIGQSALEVTGKAKIGQFDIYLPTKLLTGDTVSTGQTLFKFSEAGSIPAGSPYTVTVAQSATFVDDYGVRFTATGIPLTKVASAPATGQYSVAAGVYTFAAADQGKAVKISYTYTSASTGHTSVITNQLMGQQPVFQMALQGGYQDFTGNTTVSLVLNRCVMSKFTLPTKNTSFTVSDIEFSCFADANGNLGTFSQST